MIPWKEVRKEAKLSFLGNDLKEASKLRCECRILWDYEMLLRS